MSYEDMLARAKERAAELKAIEGDFSDEQLDEIAQLDTEIKSLCEKIAKNKAAKESLASIAASDVDAEAKAAPHVEKKERPRSFGEAFVQSKSYSDFRDAYPTGVGAGSAVNIARTTLGGMDDYFVGRKSGALLTTADAHLQNVRLPMVDQIDRPKLSLLDLVSRGQCSGNFEYLQVTSVTRKAAIVAEATSNQDGLKPISEIGTQLADAKVYTYADGYDVTNQMLSDAPALASYLNSELAYSLDSVIEDKLLNGTGVSGEPKGILTTSGVQEQTYTGSAIDDASAMEFIKAARKAITKITRLGGSVGAILLSPEMDEAIDLLQDAEKRFYGSGPYGIGPATLWGRPRVTSERLTATTAIVGDFNQVSLLDREGLSVSVFNQHKDYAQRNLNYVRAELRAAQVIWKPKHLCVVKAAG